jgi:hypothetical protein
VYVCLYQQCKALPLLLLNDIKGRMDAAAGGEEEADDGRMEDVETELAIGIGRRWPSNSSVGAEPPQHGSMSA